MAAGIDSTLTIVCVRSQCVSLDNNGVYKAQRNTIDQALRLNTININNNIVNHTKLIV